MKGVSVNSHGILCLEKRKNTRFSAMHNKQKNIVFFVKIA